MRAYGFVTSARAGRGSSGGSAASMAVATIVAVSMLVACRAASSPVDGPAPGPAKAEPDQGAVAMFRGDAAHSGVYAAASFRDVGGVAWTSHADGPVRSAAAIADGVVYVGGGDGVVRALDLTSGSELWRFDAGPAITSSPAVAGGHVIFATVAGRVHALSIADGEPVWSMDTSPFRPLRWGWDYFTPSPTVVGSTVVVAGGDGVLRALDLDTGATLLEVDLGTAIRSTPAFAEGFVFVGDVNGVVHAIDLATGDIRWRHETEGAALESSEFGFDRQTLQASAAVADGIVYIGSRDGHLYALGAVTGERLWTASYEPSWVSSSAVVTGGVVFTGTSDAHLVQALDARTGDLQWSVDVGSRVLGSPSMVGQALVVADEAGILRGLDPATGEEWWLYHGAGPFHSSPVARGGLLVLGDDAGVIHAIRGCGPSPRLAVYRDSAAARFATTPGSEELTDALAGRGYRVLDTPALGAFLEENLGSGIPSVVVFALDYLPDAVGPTQSDSLGLLRRYLDGGGKVVWLGLPPRAVVRDSAGTFVAYDATRATGITGVPFTDVEGGEYGAYPTETGTAWGVQRFQIGRLAVDPATVDRVLTTDPFGRASAWVSEFGGREGTGFVYLWGLGATPGLHDTVARVAEYGVMRATTGFAGPTDCGEGL